MLSLLPPLIAATVDPERVREAREATEAGKSFIQFDPKAITRRPRSPLSLEILEGDGAGTIYVHLLAWADVNDDGVDDIMVSILNADEYGPMASVRLIVLTRGLHANV